MSCCSGKNLWAWTIFRIGFGLALLFMGVVHYKQIDGYVETVSGDLGPLTALGVGWAYILPFLIIVGGACLILGMCTKYGNICIALALASIPAGLLLKTVMTGATINGEGIVGAFLWTLVFFPIMKKADCGWPGAHSHGDGCCSPEPMQKK